MNRHENASTEIRRFSWGDNWEVCTVDSGTDPSGRALLHAEIFRNGVSICRIVQSPRGDDPWMAANALQTQAIEWIEDWEAREHSGNTGFHDL